MFARLKVAGAANTTIQGLNRKKTYIYCGLNRKKWYFCGQYKKNQNDSERHY